LISTAWEFTIGIVVIIFTTLVAVYKFTPLSRKRKKVNEGRHKYGQGFTYGTLL
jgi:hypothetical protein